VLAERAASEGPRSTRAVKGMPNHTRWKDDRQARRYHLFVRGRPRRECGNRASGKRFRYL